MKVLANVVFTLLVALGVSGMLLGLGAREKDKPTTEAPPEQKEVVQPKAKVEPEKPAPRETPRTLSLIEAITLAEKHAGAQAIKAERRDKPEVSFRIELLDKEGGRKRVELTADGKIRETKDEPKKPEKPEPKKSEKPEPEKPEPKKPEPKKPEKPEPKKKDEGDK